jgi:3-deoxy-manno-octulosonate cytidylyltransferase (CMP-KDO synthetase)
LTAFTVLIPARRASTRLPDKVLADLNGVPMVVRVAQKAALSSAQAVAVATDDREVFSAVEKAGFRALMTRADHASGTDRLSEACALLKLDAQAIVVNVQGDEPLISPALIDEVAATLEARPDCAISTAAHPLHSLDEAFNTNIVKVALDSRNTALYFSRATIPWARDTFPGSLPPELPIYRHMGLYAYRAGFLARFPTLTPAPIERFEALEQLRALWHGERIAVHLTQSTAAPGVDTAADLELVRKLIARD